MGILAWIIIGLIAGWLTGLVMRSRGYTIIGDIIIGIVGGMLGGFLASFLLRIPNPLTGINISSVVIAFLGSVLLVALVRALPGGSPI